MVLVISEKRKYFPLIQAHSWWPRPTHPYQNPIQNNIQNQEKKTDGNRNDTKQLLSKLEVKHVA